MTLNDERIRTTHVGSLPRPEELLKFFERRQAGKPVDASAFQDAVRTATESVVRRQDEIGIDVTVNYVEPPAVVADRIERFVDAVGDPTRVVAGADCGLGTFAGFGALHPEIAWQKLESLVEGAELASERVF
ncbi:uroporphyrinogen decarboxylase/cobalamine-independent methonine synthase family protein [Halobellus limi]|uniref:Cobalamin-independent synthase, Catalytic domain n=1 Tax=Halobellus limi TaxID=699433 RepID=A0A1H5WYG9_9EURY|nr:hypothetical protein [Halobellus limi]QCC46312.1 hypothetical protein DV707_00680 [Halobellus limi]SEG04067.1 Cobalamin-independent synthase, Catalytic domain [Halobellus limi]